MSHMADRFFLFLFSSYSMKIFLAATGILASIALSAPAFAQDIDGTSSVQATGSLTTTQLSCVGTAVDVHEAAVIAAHTKFNASVMSALGARRISLAAAFTIANNQDRGVAITAAVNTYANVVKAARTTMKTELHASWKVMVQAQAACNVTIGNGSGTVIEHREGRGRRERNVEKGNNGLHLGKIKNAQKHDMDIEFSLGGSHKLDLSF